MTKRVAVDRRRTRHVKPYRVQLRFVPAPANFDWEGCMTAAADHGRRTLAAKATAAGLRSAP